MCNITIELIGWKGRREKNRQKEKIKIGEMREERKTQAQVEKHNDTPTVGENTKIKNKQQHKSTKELRRHLDDKCVPTPAAQGGRPHSQRPRTPQKHRQPEARPRS